MAIKRIQRKTNPSLEETSRIQAIRERFQRERPSLKQLVASGEFNPPIPQGAYLELRALMQSLRQERLRRGMTLTEAARRSGIEKAALSRLESGQQINPTWNTLWRYALALDKGISFGLHAVPGNGSNRKSSKPKNNPEITTDGQTLSVSPAPDSKRRAKFKAALKETNRRYGRALKRLAE